MDKRMKLWKIIPLVVLMVGCGTSPSTIPASPPASSDGQTTPRPIIVTNGTLTLTIYSPADQAVVSNPQLEIRGAVSVDAVLTLNGDTYILPPGSFTQTVSLEEGLNTLQFTVKSLLGNKVDLILTVTYQP
jgi:Glucodextranase, domain B